MNSDQGLEAAVLDAMHELIAVLDRRGTIVLVNRAWRDAALRTDAPPALVAGIGLNYLEACLHAEGDGSAGARQCHAGVLSALQGREGFELEYPCHSPTAQRWFLLRVLPVESPDGGVLIIHSEITERDQLARQLRGANRALHIRNACNRVLLRASAEAEALREVCRSIVDLGRYRFAWVGFVEDDAQRTVRPAAHAGLEDGYLASVLVTSSEREHGRGPTGTAARTGKAALVRDIRSDPAYAPWRAEALKRGYRSSVALPFAADGVVGTLNVYAAEPDAFNPTEVGLLQELANDVSIGVAALRARAERDRAVESLRSSEKKFVTVFRSLPDSSAITRLSDGLILDVNDAFTQATGYSREEAIGRTSLDLGLWRDPAARNQVAGALRRDGDIGDIEFEYGRKDGSSSVGLLASRMLIIDDEPCMLTIVRDIADRQRMEMTLRDSMRRQKALLDSIPDIAWLKDAESRFIAVNEPFAAACGRTPEDLGGRTDFDIWPEDLAARYVADDAEVMRTCTRKRVEERLVSVSGEQSWIETIKTPIVGETGNVIGTSGIARDVTERRRFAEALLREKTVSDTIINSLPGVFYVVAAGGRMTRWNRRLADVSGYDDAAIGRMQALEFIHPEDRADVEAAIREAFEQGHADVEARLRTVAGDTIPYIFTGTRMDADGAAYVVGMGIDISQRETTEDALRHSEQRLQAIVSNVPVVLFGLDSAGTFTFSEGKGLEALGLKPGEVVGRCALEMYRDYPEIVQSLRLGLKGNLSRAVHAMGPIVFDVLYMPVTDDRGALTELIGVAVDITERRRAEAALGESHARLALALEAARAGAWSWDSTTNRAVWSDGNYRVIGLEPGSCEAKYENWLARVHPDDRAAAEAAVSEAMARRGDLNIEFRVVWPDGSVHWINDVGRMIENQAGEPAGMYGIQMDITERKLAAEAIERSEANLRVTLRSIGDAVIATDGEGHVTLMNPVAQTLTGWSEEEARGRALDEVFRIINEETRARVQSPVQRVLAEGTVVGLANHTLLIDRDGVEHPIADSGAPIRPFPDAPISGVVVVFRDQSEERQITRRLEEQEAKYRNLVDQVPAAIYVAALDRDSSSLFVSSRVEEMLGYPANQIQSDPGLWLRCVHPDDRERVLAQLDRTKATGEPISVEYRLHAKNGREVWISDHAEIVRNSDGSPALLQGLMFDITDRKRAEEEVARLNDRLELRVEERTAELATAVRELEAFSYSVSHDLRAPLRAINGYTSLLKESEGDHLSADGKALLHRVLSNTLKMERLIDDILHYSRAGRQPFEPGTVNLDELVRNVAREVAEGHPRVSIAISKLPPVNGDQTMLKQIFANLIGNALKFSAGREKPLIEVGTRDEDGQTVFYVKDNGIGFDMRYASKLFGMFQRMHAGTDFPGSGVGLAVVKRLVERHRGRVWAQAELNRGAVFSFTLSPPPTLV